MQHNLSAVQNVRTVAPSSPVPFHFDGQPVRVIDRAGEPWFVAADVCAVLGLSNPTVTIKALDEDEKAKLNLGFGSDATLISEAGLWTIVLRCREATTAGSVPHRLRKWVTGEVLPSIRKSGAYGLPQTLPEALRLAADLAEQNLSLKGQVEELSPKADALERIARADGTLCITDAAKALQMRPKDLFTFLQTNGWIYKRPNGASYLAYQSKIVAGLLEHKVTTVLRADGTEKVTQQVLVTPKGLTRLAAVVPPAVAA